jgi:carbon-monoxide dehydrogenase catalytic subunit
VSDEKTSPDALKSEAEKAKAEAEKLEAQLREAKARYEKLAAELKAAAKPAEAKPAEAKPAEAKPTEATPAAAKPTEAKPAEAKPAEPKPAEAKPAAKAAAPEAGDPESLKMLSLAREKGQATIFVRAAKMKPCNIGTEGICCKICSQGPCRLPLTKSIKDGSEPDRRIGLCGATPETIAARNLIRMICAGASAHADHGLILAETLKDAADGEAADYPIKSEAKLKEAALRMGLAPDGKEPMELAKEVAAQCFVEFGRQTGELSHLKGAPAGTYERWTRLGVKPRGINREAVEIMHRTHMGVDQDYRNLLFQGVRCALADGWASSSISTDIQDAFFGEPAPQSSGINLSSLSEKSVNILLNGNIPVLAEKILEASRLPEMIEYAKGKGAEGFNLVGACSTAGELQERGGAAGAADYLQQELAVVTGAVEALVVDAQCAMEALGKLCECYHTQLITTLRQAKIQSGKNTRHLKITDKNALEQAKEILKIAADNFPSRAQASIPQGSETIMCGYGLESLGAALKGNGAGAAGVLAEAIKGGAVKGVAAVLGCNNVRVPTAASGSDPHVEIARALIKDDILVLTTGCAAMSLGRAGLLSPEAAKEAGPGLAKFCGGASIPPVIHMGSCVDNSRILRLLSGLTGAGPLGKEMAELPAAVAIPGWTSEQIVSLAFCFAASGLPVHLGFTLPIQGVPRIVSYLGETFNELYGAAFSLNPDPAAQAAEISKQVMERRGRLGLT